MFNKLPISNRRFQHFAVLTWLVLVPCGFSVMAKHEFSPRIRAGVMECPADSSIVCAPDRPTLEVLSNPAFPIPRARIAAREATSKQYSARIRAPVFLFKPAGFPPEREEPDEGSPAGGIAGAWKGGDAHGDGPRRFGRKGISQALLCVLDGRPIFRGRITSVVGLSAGSSEAMSRSSIP